jgi:hypothetical protein
MNSNCSWFTVNFEAKGLLVQIFHLLLLMIYGTFRSIYY